MKLRWCARWTVAFLIALGAALPHARVAARAEQNPPPPGTAAGIAPEALAQIEALLREKGQRSAIDRKIDSQLLYELRMSSGQPVALGVPVLQTDVPYAQDGHLVIDVSAAVTDALLATLSDRGIEVISQGQDRTMLRLHVDIDQVRALAALPDVAFVQPKQEARTRRWSGAGVPPRGSRRETIVRSLSQALNQVATPNVLFTQTGQGSQSSEGDIAHLAFAARAAFGATGAGVKIGVLSDGVANLAASQATGDLGPVTVLPGQTGTGDEGTAMLEIVHDLAPGAQLFFATAINGIQSFADNIRALRLAGCDIIVDDVFYFVETPFQDGQTSLVGNTFGGVVTQAVNEVTADGALYFSSAGNGGNLNAGSSSTWEGDFADGGPTSAPVPAGRVHSFGTQTFNVFDLQRRGDEPVLVRSARRVEQRLRPVPVEQHRHRRDRELDEHAKRHTGSVRAGEWRVRRRADRHRQSGWRGRSFPASQRDRGAPPDWDRGRDSRARRGCRGIRRCGDARVRRVSPSVQLVQHGRKLQL